MLGCEVLWIPGTDHAGIATQVVVEKRLYNEHRVSSGKEVTASKTPRARREQERGENRQKTEREMRGSIDQ